MHKKQFRRICLPRSPLAIFCLGSAPILVPRSRSRSTLLTQISNSDLGLGFSNGIVKSIRQFHQNRSRSIGIWSFRGCFDDMKHKVDPTDPTPINRGDAHLSDWILWAALGRLQPASQRTRPLQLALTRIPQGYARFIQGGEWSR